MSSSLSLRREAPLLNPDASPNITQQPPTPQPHAAQDMICGLSGLDGLRGLLFFGQTSEIRQASEVHGTGSFEVHRILRFHRPGRCLPACSAVHCAWSRSCLGRVAPVGGPRK